VPARFCPFGNERQPLPRIIPLLLLVGVLLITYFPPLTTFLPRLFK
jgi:hypothetical protein